MAKLYLLIVALASLKLVTAAVTLYPDEGISDSDIPEIVGFGDSQEQPIQHAIKNLELYATGVSQDMNLDIEMMEASWNAWNAMEPQTRHWLMKRAPLLHLFVVVGLNQWPYFQGLKYKDAARKRFLNKIYDAYKRFRHAFFGQIIGNKQYTRTDRMDLLIDSLARASGRLKITQELVDAAVAEYLQLSARLKEIEESVELYPYLNDGGRWAESPVFTEYTKILNSLNRGTVRVLVNDIFQDLDSLLRPSRVEAVKDHFIAEIAKRNFVVRYGELRWLGNVNPELL